MHRAYHTQNRLQLHKRRNAALAHMGAWPPAPVSLPTQAGDGKGWIAVAVTAPPQSKLNWAQTGGSNPAMMLVWQPPTGALQEISYGQGDDNRDWPYITPNATFTLYLLPTDAANNTYAPVESLVVKGQPGIYASPSTPAATLATLKAANPGLQVFGGPATQQTTPPPAAPWYEAAGDVSLFGTQIPVLAIVGVGLAAIFGPRLLGK